MSRFLTELRVKRIPGRWELIEPLVYESDLLQRNVTVPAGFTTDFASVPRLPISFALFGDVVHKAPVVHDFGYSEGSENRKTWDRIFLEALDAEEAGRVRGWLMYWAVRVGGWRAWGRYRG